jgi:hypothetical protein
MTVTSYGSTINLCDIRVREIDIADHFIGERLVDVIVNIPHKTTEIKLFTFSKSYRPINPVVLIDLRMTFWL